MLGTTLGMMLANAPAVFLGDKLANKLPISLIHKIGAAIFLVNWCCDTRFNIISFK